jgi:hypothetical protein
MDELDAEIIEFERHAAEIRARRLGAVSRTEALKRVASRPTEWVVRGLFVSTDYGVLAGPKGVGKTFALLDLAVSVALGAPWFDRFTTQQQIVLVLTSEDSEARLWQRIDAICRARGREPAFLDGRLFVHPLPFSAISDLDRLRAELQATRAGFVVVDPAYKYLAGARPSSLFEMGAALTPLQVVCAEAGALLLVGHHYNRREGVNREDRISGAGLLEWARVVVTATAPPRRDEDPDVVVTFEVTGNSIDPVTFRVCRRVVALDDTPDPELSYEVEVLAEGAEARASAFMTASERVLAVLQRTVEDALLVREIGDRVAHDTSGKGGLKHDTIRRVLNRDLDSQVDRIGDHPDVRWWRP